MSSSVRAFSPTFGASGSLTDIQEEDEEEFQALSSEVKQVTIDESQTHQASNEAQPDAIPREPRAPAPDEDSEPDAPRGEDEVPAWVHDVFHEIESGDFQDRGYAFSESDATTIYGDTDWTVEEDAATLNGYEPRRRSKLGGVQQLGALAPFNEATNTLIGARASLYLDWLPRRTRELRPSNKPFQPDVALILAPYLSNLSLRNLAATSWRIRKLFVQNRYITPSLVDVSEVTLPLHHSSSCSGILRLCSQLSRIKARRYIGFGQADTPTRLNIKILARMSPVYAPADGPAHACPRYWIYEEPTGEATCSACPLRAKITEELHFGASKSITDGARGERYFEESIVWELRKWLKELRALTITVVVPEEDVSGVAVRANFKEQFPEEGGGGDAAS